MVAEREQRPHRLRRIGLAGELDRALEVLAGALGVADAAEDAAEDPVGAARGPGLAEALGEPQRLLRGVDREHVVAGVHVERGGLLVQPHELEAGRAVLEQVDAALVVLDRGLAVALLPEPGADLAMQVADPGEVLLAAVVLHALVPGAHGAIDAAEQQRDVAELLRDPGDGLPVELAAERRAPPRSDPAPRCWSRARPTRRRRPRAPPAPAPGSPCSSPASRSAAAPRRGGARVVLGDHRDHALGAVGRARRR